MSDLRMQAIHELARRGALPADLAPAYDEAVRRGLISDARAAPADGPWTKFQKAGPAAPAEGPWTRFQKAGPAPQEDGPWRRFASVQSGDEARAKAAGDTRATMRPEDIEFAYDTAAERGDRSESEKMARAYVDRERADSEILIGVDDRLRAVARGVPIIGSAADEANAFLSAPISATAGMFGLGDGKAYNKALDYQRARDASFDERRPWESTGLQIAGGVASGLAAAPMVAAAVPGMSVGGGIAAGATAGAGLGTVDGFARGEDGAGNRAGSAVAGGVLGGAFGGAVPIAAKGIAKGWEALTNSAVARDTLKGLGLSRPAASALARGLEADNILAGQGAANIRAAGPDAMLADAGPAMSGMLDVAIQRGGPGTQAARAAIEDRAASAGGRIREALDDTLGAPRGMTSAEEAIRLNSAPARGEAYESAYSRPIDYVSKSGREIEEMVRERVPPSIIAKANSLMRIEGQQSRQILAKIADDGTVTFERMPDVRQLDYITRALKDVSKAGDGQGAMGGNTAEGRAYGSLAQGIRDRLRRNVPEYGFALDTASDPIAQREALELGQRLMRPATTRDEAATELAGMSKAELQRVREGIRAQVDEVIANVKRSAADSNVEARQAIQGIRDLSSEAARSKIRLVVGQAEADRLFNSIDEAARAFELRAATATNSRTFGRQAVNDAVQRATEPGVVGQLLEGSPAKATLSVIQAMTGRTPEARLAKEDAVYQEIVKALTERRGADSMAMAQDIADAVRRQGQGQKSGAALGALTTAPAAGGGYAPLIENMIAAQEEQRRRDPLRLTVRPKN